MHSGLLLVSIEPYWMSSQTNHRNDLRRELRALRRKVTRSERASAARSFVVGAERAHLLRPASRVAIYQPFGHEADVSRLTERAWQRGCEVYLPVVRHRRRAAMRFVPFRPDMRLELNVFGIAEPADSARWIPPLHLDVIFMPLVGFDRHGWRLGSGAGFYDRCLRHLRVLRQWRRPKLVGIAYERQRIDELRPGTWDVPMDAVLTESRLYRFDTHQGSAR